MATSGSTDFNLTRNEIIKDALIILGAVGSEESVDSSDTALAARVLNSMVKAWQGRGVHLWTHQEASLFVIKGTESYSLPGSDAANTSVSTTLSAAEASGQTVLSVTSSTGMTAADIVLIELTDGTYEDTTIVSVDSALQITITDALTSAAASGNNVYSYTTAMGRPLEISSIRLHSDSGYDRILNSISRSEYFGLPDKTSQGQPVSYYYDPQLSTGTLRLWPAPDAIDYSLKLTYSRSIEDFDTSSNTPDFPPEWLEALTYNLAVRLAPMFGKDQKAIQMIAPMALQMLEEIKMWDNENGSLSVTPDRRFD